MTTFKTFLAEGRGDTPQYELTTFIDLSSPLTTIPLDVRDKLETRLREAAKPYGSMRLVKYHAEKKGNRKTIFRTYDSIPKTVNISLYANASVKSDKGWYDEVEQIIMEVWGTLRVTRLHNCTYIDNPDLMKRKIEGDDIYVCEKVGQVELTNGENLVKIIKRCKHLRIYTNTANITTLTKIPGLEKIYVQSSIWGGPSNAEARQMETIINKNLHDPSQMAEDLFNAGFKDYI